MVLDQKNDLSIMPVYFGNFTNGKVTVPLWRSDRAHPLVLGT